VRSPSPSAGALGLAGFALTTFVLSVFNANLLPKMLEGVVLPLAAFYGGLVQLLAGMWEFKRGPAGTFGAVAFSSYGAFWMSFAGYVWFIAPTLPTADEHNATGLFLFAWWMFTLYMTAASLKTYGALVAVFAVLNFAFLFLIIGAFGAMPKATIAGGWFGIVCAGLAWYCSAAQILKATWGRLVLPIWPLNGVKPAQADAGAKR
jgi:succinate-acetate transporter protein